jgi:Protein of unknown function (DUF559)
MHEAEVRLLTDPLSLNDLVLRYPRQMGLPLIKRILADRAIGQTVTRSELEARFLAFLDEVGLPRPATNAPIALGDGTRVEADCVWSAARLIVELDGHASHATSQSFERDRRRDRALSSEGWTVVRVTWRQLHAEQAQLAEDLRALIGAGELAARGADPGRSGGN